jgi:hypothetical protein
MARRNRDGIGAAPVARLSAILPKSAVSMDILCVQQVRNSGMLTACITDLPRGDATS